MLKVYKLILPDFKVGFVKVAKSQKTFKYFSPDEIQYEFEKIFKKNLNSGIIFKTNRFYYPNSGSAICLPWLQVRLLEN